MCGITGYKLFNKKLDLKASLNQATQRLYSRGPDHQSTFMDKSVGLGHTRLSIIDTSSNGNQPMTDQSGRYTLVFNGEIYNYKALARQLDVSFISSTDTEVLLYLLIKEGKSCLGRLNGFFTLAFYDKETEELLLARDRMGIKPLHYYQNEDFFAFGSEMKALMQYPVERIIDNHSLELYLRLTYLPFDKSILKDVKKLLPAHYLHVKGLSVESGAFWEMSTPRCFSGSYEEAKSMTIQLLEQAVERRMVSDVPLGSFLSGGTDSSAVVAMASRFNPHLHTFSIGYQNHSFFDETNYAELVAEKFQTNHTTFSLTNDDLLHNVSAVVDYMDEPFADSSAIPTYILSQRVRKNMTVALSGDGADELFGGYYKHLAFQRSVGASFSNRMIGHVAPFLGLIPQSRSSKIGNLARRIKKYAELLKLSNEDKYWLLASFNPNANSLMKERANYRVFHDLSEAKAQIETLNDFLDLDLQMVLPGDMLTKVDLMSMANSLEVRVPFLDKDLVDFARSLPTHFKVNGKKRKAVLQDAFEHILPKALHHRSKKGFEVPMLGWMRKELACYIDEVMFNKDYLNFQSIFKPDEVIALKKKLHSNNPGDVHTIIWSIFVFQIWYKKIFNGE